MGPGPSKGKGKEKEKKPEEAPIDFLSPEQRARLGFKSKFLASLVQASLHDLSTYYQITFGKEIFGRGESIQLTLKAIKEYLEGDSLDAMIMLVYCM